MLPSTSRPRAIATTSFRAFWTCWEGSSFSAAKDYCQGVIVIDAGLNIFPLKILEAFELEAKISCATRAPSPTTTALTTEYAKSPILADTGLDNEVQQQMVQVGGEVESIDMSDAPWKKTRLLSPDRPSECEGLGDPRCVANCTEAATAAGVST
mmetsp:Transcript_64957/g.210447  ORF Transcript_64957/g.210447 Transcript_64957/m.210447 type:complete len:154 (-) Transcript_64957:686-1147(-)